jgi:WD40 repeat protein
LKSTMTGMCPLLKLPVLFPHMGIRAITTVSSYFGSFLCASWSANGKYILSGSEDDLVSLWHWDRSSEKLQLLARGEGHNSYVSAVAFDEHHCSDTLLRFGSVAEDGKLILWEYSVRDDLLSKVHDTLMEPNGNVYAHNSSMHPPSSQGNGSARSTADNLDINSFIDVPPKNSTKTHSISTPIVSKKYIDLMSSCFLLQFPDSNAF